MRQASPPTARRALPWSVGIGRMAVHYPDRYDRNQSAIVAPLEREVDAAVQAGSGRSPDPSRDAWLIFGYTDETVRRHLIHDRAPDRPTVELLVSFAFRALGRASG